MSNHLIMTAHLSKQLFCVLEYETYCADRISDRPEGFIFFMKKTAVRFLSVIGLTVMTLCADGCAYRPDVYQGNFTEQKDVDKLRVGTRWYYINFVRKGWSDPEFKTLVVLFDDDRVVKEISGDFQKSRNFYTPL